MDVSCKTAGKNTAIANPNRPAYFKMYIKLAIPMAASKGRTAETKRRVKRNNQSHFQRGFSEVSLPVMMR